MGDTDELRDKIEAAFGYDGLGILAVKNVPGFVERREALIPLAREVAHLPDEEKAKIEDPDSCYSIGWSHGKEKFFGKPDYSKGSFYGNPLHDRVTDDEELIRQYRPFLTPNLWPEGVPGLRDAFMNLGQLIIHVGQGVARHCDKFVHSKLESYPPSRLEDIIRTSRVPKSRLLYYFAMDPGAASSSTPSGVQDAEHSTWCGWHNDHGSLTGLAPAMYFDEEGNQIPCPDNEAGLYIRGRDGNVYRVRAQTDWMLFQIGETAQIHSGGLLQATPHSVRASSVPGVSRGTYAVFMEPEWNEPMTVPEGADKERVLRGARGELLPPGVPALHGRWDDSMDFNQFTNKTLDSYY